VTRETRLGDRETRLAPLRRVPLGDGAGVFTNTIFGFIQAYILLAVFRTGRTSGATTPRTRSPTSGGAGADHDVYAFGWTELALRIRDGSIATDLARPLDPSVLARVRSGPRALSPDLPRICRSSSARPYSGLHTRPLDLVAVSS